MATPKLKIIPITLGIILVAGAGFFFLMGTKDADSTHRGSPTSTVGGIFQREESSVAVAPPPEGWREYRNTAQGFSLYYPPELVPREFDEGNETFTITFEPEGGGVGFQIFFTAYLGDAITQSRLLKDIPSGEFTVPVETTIGDGVRAITFDSVGPLGPMHEMWFLHSGYLFEVTGYKELEVDLTEVVRSITFK